MGDHVFLEVEVDGQPIGSIKINLHSELVPRTAHNFAELCTGESKKHCPEGNRLCYKGSRIHRIVRGCMIQGGDVTRGDGTGGWSTFGKHFPDEDLRHRHKHNAAGTVSMANAGLPHTNQSQFFILTEPQPQLDGAYVVVGRVYEGMEVVKQLERLPTDIDDKPLHDVQIRESGHCV